ncbi:unnamed protein product [Caenorhabditis brenneri]
MKSSKSKNAFKVNPYYYHDDYYFYGDPDDLEYVEYDWLFGNYDEYLDIFIDVTNILVQIYQVACFISFFINLAHLIILTRKELRSSVVFIVMTGVCICDICHSVGKIAQLVMTWDIVYKIEKCDDGLKYSHHMVDLVSKTIQIMNRQCSAFLVLFVAAFRAFSVIFPMSNLGNQMMKPVTGFLVVVVAVIITTAWSSTYFFKANFKPIFSHQFRPKNYINYSIHVTYRIGSLTTNNATHANHWIKDSSSSSSTFMPTIRC